MRRCAKQGRSSCSNDFQITIKIRIRNDCAAFQCQLRFSGAWQVAACCTQSGGRECALCGVLWCGVACLSLSECCILLSCNWNLNINWLLIGATASYLFVVLICLMMQQFSARQLAKLASLSGQHPRRVCGRIRFNYVVLQLRQLIKHDLLMNMETNIW